MLMNHNATYNPCTNTHSEIFKTWMVRVKGYPDGQGINSWGEGEGGGLDSPINTITTQNHTLL